MEEEGEAKGETEGEDASCDCSEAGAPLKARIAELEAEISALRAAAAEAE